MNDIPPCEVHVSNQNLLHEGNSLRLRESFFDGLVEVRLAQLGNDVGVILGGIDLVQGQDMRQGFEFLEYLNFAFEEDFIDFVLEQAEVDNFDGNWVGGLVVPALVDMAGVSLADDVVESIGIALYFLAGIGAAHEKRWFASKKKNNI